MRRFSQRQRKVNDIEQFKYDQISREGEFKEEGADADEDSNMVLKRDKEEEFIEQRLGKISSKNSGEYNIGKEEVAQDYTNTDAALYRIQKELGKTV